MEQSQPLRITPYPKIKFSVSIDTYRNSKLYTDMVNWCIDQFRYDPVLIYGILQFKTQQDLNWFLLKWK